MYLPEEDSYFLSEILANYLKTQNRKIRILDLGSGTGILAQTCLNLGFKNIISADIDLEVIKFLKNKFKNQVRVIKTDLFSKIKNKFDLIIFNPPYLPEDKFDKEKDTTAGKSGNELIIKFLKQAKSHLNKQGKILILFSSLSNPGIILKTAKNLKYKPKLLASKNLFFEKLFVYELS
jgi:release factor glutamine methyltransferase